MEDINRLLLKTLDGGQKKAAQQGAASPIKTQTISIYGA
jgi:hypothetical protein